MQVPVLFVQVPVLFVQVSIHTVEHEILLFNQLELLSEVLNQRVLCLDLHVEGNTLVLVGLGQRNHGR